MADRSLLPVLLVVQVLLAEVLQWQHRSDPDKTATLTEALDHLEEQGAMPEAYDRPAVRAPPNQKMVPAHH